MRYLVLAIAAIVIGIALYGTLFTVHQTKQAIVMQFGEPKKVIIDPGLNWKIPFIQDVTYYEKRVLNLDPPVENMLLSDQKRLLVDSFARYRILDPLAFFQSVRSEAVAKQRLGGIINASLRDVLGNTTLASVLSEDRIALMIEIREHVNRQTGRFGIEIVDVRIRRADLPDQASQSVYARMQTEREREAAEFRAQGFEQAQRIKAAADREATVIQAEAKRESEILKGQGEGRRTEILNDAYGRDAGFFNFYRSMQAYEAALGGESTYMVLSPDSEFFDFFDQVERGARP
jgi:membrane protease subunit HflC